MVDLEIGLKFFDLKCVIIIFYWLREFENYLGRIFGKSYEERFRLELERIFEVRMMYEKSK